MRGTELFYENRSFRLDGDISDMKDASGFVGRKVTLGQKKKKSSVYCNMSGKKWVDRSGFFNFFFYNPNN